MFRSPRFLFLFLVLLAVEPGTTHAQQWVSSESAGGIGNDHGTGVAIDREGNRYVLGEYRQAITFGGITLPSPGSPSVFLAKYDVHHSLVWVRNIAKTNDTLVYVYANTIAVSPTGEIYIGGSYRSLTGGGVPFSLRVFDTTLSGKGSSGMYLMKLSSSGSLIWVRGESEEGRGSYGQNSIFSLCLDRQGAAYFTGSYNSKAVFDTIVLNSSSPTEVFIAKYNAEGRVVWAKSGTAYSIASGVGVALDSNGNCYATGIFFSEIKFNQTDLQAGNAEQKIYLLKIDPNGKMLWAQRVGSGGYYGGANDIATDRFGNIVLIGDIRSSIDLGVTTLDYENGLTHTAFAIELDSSGKALWGSIAQGAGSMALKAAIDPSGAIWVTGGFNLTCIFGDLKLQDTSKTFANGFVLRMNAQGKFTWASQLMSSSLSIGNGIANLGNGACSVVGDYNGSMHVGTNSLTSVGGSDVFLADLAIQSSIGGNPQKHSPTAYLYPNPSKDFIRIPLDGEDQVQIVTIISSLGDKISRNERSGIVDIHDLVPGAYTVLMGSSSYRFVKW